MIAAGVLAAFCVASIWAARKAKAEAEAMGDGGVGMATIFWLLALAAVTSGVAAVTVLSFSI